MLDSCVQEDTFFALKKRAHHCTVSPPDEGCHLGNTSQNLIVCGQWATFEIMHDQQHIHAMLKGTQVHGVGEVIADIEAHPVIELSHAVSPMAAIAHQTWPAPTSPSYRQCKIAAVER